MRGNGVSYDTGFINAGVSTHEPFDLEVVKREMRVIHDDLHCSPARLGAAFRQGTVPAIPGQRGGRGGLRLVQPDGAAGIAERAFEANGFACDTLCSLHTSGLSGARPRPSAGCHRPGLYYRERTGSAWCGRGDSHGRRRPTRRSRGAIRPGAAKTRSANRRLSYGEIGA